MKRLLLVTMTVGLLGMATMASAARNASARQSLQMTLPETKFDNVALGDAMEFLRDVSGANLHVNWRALEAASVTKDTQVNLRLRSVKLEKVLDLLLAEASPDSALTYYLDQGVIEVTTREISDKQLITKVYPVEDLIMDIPEFDDAPNFNLNANSSNSNKNNNNSNGNNNSGNGSGNGIFNTGSGSGGSGSGGSRTQAGTKKSDKAAELVALIQETIRPEIWKENGGPASVKYYNGSLIVTAPRSVHEAIGGPID